jgi:hypothetical protein
MKLILNRYRKADLRLALRNSECELLNVCKNTCNLRGAVPVFRNEGAEGKYDCLSIFLSVALPVGRPSFFDMLNSILCQHLN